MFTLFLAVVFCFGAVLFVCLCQSVYVVKQSEAIIIERFGKYHRTLGPGIYFTVPYIDSPRQVFWTYLEEDHRGRIGRRVRSTYRIDVRESVYDFPQQHVITKDNVTMEINALLYYHITHPHYAVYQFDDLPEGIEKLTQTTLRNVIGSMDLDETLASRDDINKRLRSILDEATDPWGVKVSRVELQAITPPEDIRQAMEKQMRAERDRRANILEAEGKKRSMTLCAEGEREAAVLKARGTSESRILEAEAEAKARKLKAEAEAEALSSVHGVLGDTQVASQYLVAQNYITTLPYLTEGKDNKMVVVPYEAAQMTGSLAQVAQFFDSRNGATHAAE